MRLPEWFDRFLAPDADRPGIILDELTGSGVSASMVRLGNGRFVIAWAGAYVVSGRRRDPRYRVKILTAHHDRVPGTPGALDNSAACLQLVTFLQQGSGAFNTMVVFTDHEEMAGTQTEAQGSHALGTALPDMDVGQPYIVCLDVTGRGDTLVMSDSVEGLVQRQYRHLLSTVAVPVREMMDQVTRLMAGRGKVCTATLPFGEDLGFLMASAPALELSVLPGAEAALLPSSCALPPWASPVAPGQLKPATWKHLHGAGDTVDLFDDSAFALMGTFIHRLAGLRSPEPIAT
mgnify:FL=1